MESLRPLGDQAALASFPTEDAAARWAAAVRRRKVPWLIDVVQAYTTVAVFFDLDQVGYRSVAPLLRDLRAEEDLASVEAGHLHLIPCCYELGPDLERVARHTGRTADEVVRLHTGVEYTVYAIGFCPGFPYLGYLPPALCGIPRLPAPRLRVEPGSVGLTGRQTGIYTEARPGGWNLVGRTPLELVHVADGYFPLRTGDRVRFRAVDQAQFHSLLGRRL